MLGSPLTEPKSCQWQFPQWFAQLLQRAAGEGLAAWDSYRDKYLQSMYMSAGSISKKKPNLSPFLLLCTFKCSHVQLPDTVGDPRVL